MYNHTCLKRKTKTKSNSLQVMPITFLPKQMNKLTNKMVLPSFLVQIQFAFSIKKNKQKRKKEKKKERKNERKKNTRKKNHEGGLIRFFDS